MASKKSEPAATDAAEQTAPQFEPLKDTPLIYSAMLNVMADIDAIVKKKQSSGVAYKFRSIEDVMNAVHPILVRHGVLIVPDVMELKTNVFEQDYTKQVGQQNVAAKRNLYQSVLQMRYTFIALDGSTVVGSIAAEASDYSDKATQQSGSYCYKDIILKTFCVPTEDVQDDGDGKQPDRTNTAPAKTAPTQPQLTTAPIKATNAAIPTPPQPAPTPTPAAVEAAKTELDKQPSLVDDAVWAAIKTELAQFELDDHKFHTWCVITLRKAGMVVPERMDLLTKKAAGFLWKIARKSNVQKELVDE